MSIFKATHLLNSYIIFLNRLQDDDYLYVTGLFNDKNDKY